MDGSCMDMILKLFSRDTKFEFWYEIIIQAALFFLVRQLRRLLRRRDRGVYGKGRTFLGAVSYTHLFNALSGGGLSALKGDYYILNCTDYPSVIAECGFLSNPEEDALLNTQEYQKKVAYALYKGIVAFIAHNVAGWNENHILYRK